MVDSFSLAIGSIGSASGLQFAWTTAATVANALHCQSRAPIFDCHKEALAKRTPVLEGVLSINQSIMARAIHRPANFVPGMPVTRRETQYFAPRSRRPWMLLLLRLHQGHTLLGSLFKKRTGSRATKKSMRRHRQFCDENMCNNQVLLALPCKLVADFLCTSRRQKGNFLMVLAETRAFCAHFYARAKAKPVPCDADLQIFSLAKSNYSRNKRTNQSLL
jgi:hypothetical protein